MKAICKKSLKYGYKGWSLEKGVVYNVEDHKYQYGSYKIRRLDGMDFYSLTEIEIREHFDTIQSLREDKLNELGID